jgi:hypothetical protein
MKDQEKNKLEQNLKTKEAKNNKWKKKMYLDCEIERIWESKRRQS